MVISSAIKPQKSKPFEKPEKFKWSSVSLNEVFNNNRRLEASVFGIEGKRAREIVNKSKWGSLSLDSFIKNIFYPGRFKRVYVKKNYGVPFFLPSQINDIYPEPLKYISYKQKEVISLLKINSNQILITRSGTIGNCTIVSKTLEGSIFSDDVIRIDLKDVNEVGYIYAYLKSDIGRILVNTNNYGSVVSHIEPEHLNEIPIPNPHPIIKQKIHNLVMSSFLLRDESNALMDEAQLLLKKGLNLPDINDFIPKYFNDKSEFQNFSVNLAKLGERFDASFHLSIVDAIEQHLINFSREVTVIGDNRISQGIILPGRFKRIYVKEGQGVIFFGGKQLLELDPSNKKYLSLQHHKKRIKEELTLHKNMLLITRSGAVGKVNIAPEHWDGWTASEHIIRIVPINDDISGFLYAWLASDYAYPLITRFTYGSVVDEIDDHHVSRISIPLLHDIELQRVINDKVLESNQKRYEAYLLEQEALKMMDEKVILAT